MKIINLIISLIICISALTSCSGNSGNEAVPQNVIDVEYVDMMNAYHSNEVQGDNLYKGKTVRIKAIVESVTKSLGDIDVMLVGNAQCKLKEGQSSKAATLKNGDWVTIQGRCSGLFLGTALFGDCEIIQ
jgi:hypothetical protein